VTKHWLQVLVTGGGRNLGDKICEGSHEELNWDKRKSKLLHGSEPRTQQEIYRLKNSNWRVIKYQHAAGTHFNRKWGPQNKRRELSIQRFAGYRGREWGRGSYRTSSSSHSEGCLSLVHVTSLSWLGKYAYRLKESKQQGKDHLNYGGGTIHGDRCTVEKIYTSMFSKDNFVRTKCKMRKRVPYRRRAFLWCDGNNQFLITRPCYNTVTLNCTVSCM
jgi:hypothetical protein